MRCTIKIFFLSLLVLFCACSSESQSFKRSPSGVFYPIPYQNTHEPTLVLLAETPEISPEHEYIFGEEEEGPLSLKEALDLQEAAGVLEYNPEDLSHATLPPLLQYHLKAAYQKTTPRRLIVVDYGKKCNSDSLKDTHNQALDLHARRLRHFSDLLRQSMPQLQVDLHLAQPTGRIIPIPHTGSWTDLKIPS